MSRTVTALYESRAEAETARARLVSEVKTQSTRIIAKDTAAAVDTLKIDPANTQAYRDAIRQGCHLLVAEIEAGQDPKRVISALEQAVGSGAGERDAPSQEAAAYGVTAEVEEAPVQLRTAEPPAQQRFEEPRVEQPKVQQPIVQQPQVAERAEPRPIQPAQATPVEEERIPLVQEELRIDRRQVSRGGARVRSVIRETPAEEHVQLTAEHVDVENRPSERRLSLEEVKSGGLLKERIFEIREMREEPVITKEAFVREEVIVRKTVQERTETVRDTVRRTEVEVEELPARSDESRRGFFGGRPNRK